MERRARLRIKWLSLIIPVLLIITVFADTASAAGVRIESFNTEDPAASITVNVGTALDTVKAALPRSLEAVTEDGATENVAVTWTDGALYRQDEAGSYVFTAIIDTSFSYAGASPVAYVTVTGTERRYRSRVSSRIMRL